ncbi:angiopoietin-related protein 3 isoform X1 [Latimeria chalumnae]|uniref:Angiopoietin like 3 n=1 Tax=Latimeria chalumnae TaxID=7897 RepID=H3A8A8_LATCH|nr:PREDICTED: angiopoietin-related protein 3 isoform X1 [Latimeria chalumnae]|eukprot:XP_006010494.1 PREDICTED: angiopoietin-related protein 3 isoform X1 [Latimeria chalumnae]
MKSLLILLLLTASYISLAKNEKDISVDPIPIEQRSRFAMLDDVRILANGLLQLGHGLKDFVHKTKTQINDIFAKLNIFDQSFYELSVQTNEIKVDEQELKKTTTELQVNNEELKNISSEMNTKITEIVQERRHLEKKVGGLEEKLSELTHNLPEIQELNEISSLKNLVEEQDKSIKDLLKTVHEQHKQLDNQKNQIKEMEEKLNQGVIQDSTESSFTSVHVQPKTIDYLTENKTGATAIHSGHPFDCNDIYNEDKSSGVYPIKPNGSEPFNVYCEMTADGGWTVIQRRIDGSVDFDQTWDRYVNGFGDLEGEFWLGLEKLYFMSQQGDYILHIELKDWKNSKRFIEYIFSLGSKETHYILQLTQTAGNVPNAMSEQTKMRFSTKEDSNCGENHSGGWWYNACDETNLNGKYIKLRARGKTERRKGMYWKSEGEKFYTLKSTKMMIRPVDFEHFD